jgi:hypothetical protein
VVTRRWVPNNSMPGVRFHKSDSWCTKMSSWDTIISKAFHAIGMLTVRSALNPVLWLCGLVTLPSVVASTFMTVIPTWLIVLAMSPVATALFGFLFLLFVDRDKLQSESFQLRKQALELIEDKGDFKAIDASTIEVISNPDLPALPAPDKEEGR